MTHLLSELLRPPLTASHHATLAHLSVKRHYSGAKRRFMKPLETDLSLPASYEMVVKRMKAKQKKAVRFDGENSANICNKKQVSIDELGCYRFCKLLSLP